jgi:hypothetical protein
LQATEEQLLNFATGHGEYMAFHGWMKFIAPLVCTGISTLKDMVLGFKSKFAARALMGIYRCGADFCLLGASVSQPWICLE